MSFWRNLFGPFVGQKLAVKPIWSQGFAKILAMAKNQRFYRRTAY